MESSSTLLALSLTFGLGVLYVLYGSPLKKKSSGSKNSPRGLSNPGTMCYINAVLQSLSSLDSLVSWLSDQRSNFEPQSLLLTLTSIFSHVNRREENLKNDSLSHSTHLLRALRSHGWIIETSEQDSHELLNILLTSLEEEIEKTNNKASLNMEYLEENEDDEITENKDIEEFHGRRRRRRSSGVYSRSSNFNELPLDSIQNSFVSNFPSIGTLTNQIINKSLRNPLQCQHFHSITLHLPPRPTSEILTLNTLLRHFTSRESLENDISKTVKFGKLPPILIFHIQRTSMENGIPLKRNDVVQFPSTLNMGTYVYSPQHSLRASYRLKAVIEHFGVLSSGHYVTFRLGLLDFSTWYFISDDSVENVSFSRVSASNPYLLFYEKI